MVDGRRTRRRAAVCGERERCARDSQGMLAEGGKRREEAWTETHHTGWRGGERERGSLSERKGTGGVGVEVEVDKIGFDSSIGDRCLRR